jgi:hypothetical protein
MPGEISFDRRLDDEDFVSVHILKEVPTHNQQHEQQDRGGSERDNLPG